MEPGCAAFLLGLQGNGWPGQRNTQTWQSRGVPLGSAPFPAFCRPDVRICAMFRGSMPALVTPFRNGELDVVTLKKLVDWQIAEGSRGLVPVGTTGESPTLSHDEHKAVIEIVVKAAAGRVPVIAGAGSNNTTEAIDLIRHAEKAGANAALVVTPYYNKPTQRGLIAHYRALHDACGLPIIIYNIPSRSVIDMTPETMGELAQLPRIVGVKDATGRIERVSQQRASCGADFIQLSGEDATALGFNAHGGIGCISVTANVAPRLCAAFQEATLAGDYATALTLQDRLMPLHEAIFIEPGLIGAKYGMSRLGLCSDEVRLPHVGLLDTTKARIDAAMRHAGLLN
jgi:4-hydroxy-tetrahydrodipicolinate synthase